MHILAHGFAPKTPAGMGIVLEELMKRVSAEGHKVTWVAPNGTDITWNGCEVVSNPRHGSITTNTILQKTLNNTHPDIYFSNLNWLRVKGVHKVLNSFYEKYGKKIPVVLHSAVESEEFPPEFYEQVISKHVNPVHYIPYTKPHYDRLEDTEWCQTYIPHGVRSAYHGEPVRKGDIYREFGCHPDSIKIVATVATNKRRKNLDRWLKVASCVKNQYDGNVRFIMHTSPQPNESNTRSNGWDLPKCAKAERLIPDQDILWSRDYPMQNVQKEYIDSIYNDADVYLSMSGGEGFGLPIVESMSRGTACVLTNHDNHEWVAKDGALYVPSNDSYRLRSGDVLKLPDIQIAADHVVELLENENKRSKLSKSAVERSEKFRWSSSSKKLIKYFVEEAIV